MDDEKSAKQPGGVKETMSRNDAPAGAAASTGDPGRTPGSAEGDEETVEASLRKHETEEK